MKKIIVLFGLFLSCFAFSQGENNNWYFGNKAAVTFNTNPPSALTDSAMNAFEGVATISDSNGNLLFYTNGQTIWNRQHQEMTNGTGLSAVPSTQQTLILPKPGSSTLYFVFTMTAADNSSTFTAYSIVDMSLGSLGANGQPLGGVSDIKNELILNGNGLPITLNNVSEAITAVEHEDNQSYWVLIPNGDILYAYTLDSTGFDNGNPITSDLNFSENFENWGHIRISPKLPYELDLAYSHLVAFTRWNAGYLTFYLYVRGFDNSTGLISDSYSLDVTASLDRYSSEFSSDGILLYAGRLVGGNLIVLNLFPITEDIEDMMRVVYNGGGNHGYGCSLQRAIDNNIYYSISNSNYLAQIENPDSFTLSSINFQAINLNGKKCRYGLPQLVPILNGYGNLCSEFLTLSHQETLNSNIYKASNIITTMSNYSVADSKDITLNAGNAVYILPNTHIENGSIFRAMIEGCENVANKKRMAKNTKPVRRTINLDDLNKKEVTDLKIYPNPVKDVINIVNTTVIDNVIITDMNGRVVKQVVLGVSEGQINISDLSQGVYILNATSNGKSVTEKIVKQ